MKKKTLISILTVIISFSIISISAYAKELPVEIPSSNQASVSKEVDIAQNTKPNMGTDIFMYIPPDVIENDIPNMGDNNTVEFPMIISILSGSSYLALSFIARGGKRYNANA